MNIEIKKKVNTIGKVGRIITIILKVLAIAGIVCLCLGAVLTRIIPEDAITVDMEGTAQIKISEKIFKGKIPIISEDGLEGGSFTIGGEKYETVSVEQTDDGVTVNMQANDVKLDVRAVALRSCLIGLVYMAAVLVMLCFLKKLMGELETCDTPFAPGVIKRMTNYAWSLIPMAVLSGFSGTEWILLSARSGRISYSVNLHLVLIILVILALVQVFKYGAQLQQQADETL